MPTTTSHKTMTYIANLPRLPIDDLAQEYFRLTDQLLDSDNAGSATAIRQMMAVVDAIGHCLFPAGWEQARDNADYRQDVA